MKLQALCRRTTWEIVRDPLNLAFGLGFPLVLLLLLSAIQANVPVDLFAIERLTPGISVFGLAFIALFSATLVARDRESALLQRLYTAPLTAGDFIFGYVLPLAPMAAVQAAVCYLAAIPLGLTVSVRMIWAVLLDLPAMTTVEGTDCAAVVETLRRELCRQETARAARWEDMTAYYTAWVHQIKTPIAAMRLTLQGEDTPAARRLMTELGRVEQYVDMALTYLRLEEGGSDYVIRTCAVDDVVRAAVRRFAGEFIDRRIALDYTPVEWETVTDGKWLTFVVEQLLSNALKYTGQDGTVRIYREGDDLCIRDSGMGIAPEDLPRVFDMGYTGQNGRLDRRSSGIGLYLCRRICRNLRHEIRIESVPGVGTTVRLTLGRGDFLPE